MAAVNASERHKAKELEMKRVSEISCVVTECYHQDEKTVTNKETGKSQHFKESTRVTADYMGGKLSLNAVDPNFKCDIGKLGVLQVEEELLPVRYTTNFGEKFGNGWVLVSVVGFKVK